MNQNWNASPQKDVSYFPDGRSVVNTMGGRRFRVVSRGMRDGYNTAKVEIIHDVPETEADAIQSKPLIGSLRLDWSLDTALFETISSIYSLEVQNEALHHPSAVSTNSSPI